MKYKIIKYYKNNVIDEETMTIEELKEQLAIRNREIKRLYDEIEQLESQLQQKENIIKEVREYINNHQLVFELSSKEQISHWYDMLYKALLEILDKEKQND